MPTINKRRAGAVALSYYDVVTADAPVVQLKMNEASGALSNSGSGGASTNASVGTITYAAATGVVGGVQGLTGSSNGAFSTAAPSTMGLFDYNTRTYEAWVKLSSNSTQQMILDTTLFNTGGGAFGIDSSGKPYVIIVEQTVLTATTITAVSALSTGQWYHIVATVNVLGNIKIYINGTLDKTQAAPVSYNNNGRSAKGGFNRILCDGSSTDLGSCANFFSGSIDEVAVYASNELSQARVTAHYNAGIGA